MRCNWKQVKLKEVCDFSKKSIKPRKGIEYTQYSLPAFDNDKTPEITFGENILSSKFIVEKDIILFNKLNLRFKRVWNIKEISENSICSTEFIPILAKSVDKTFLYYILISDNVTNELEITKTGTSSSHQRIKPEVLFEYEIFAPPLETQKQISKILSSIDDKIELNNMINDNLEQQAQAIFEQLFGEAIADIDNNNNTSLDSLVRSIDNRGKTPPLSQISTGFPIIDVRALAGKSRIINFNNCSKYVDEQTYNEWFRNGHPIPLDILISTVGSLAEMKLFFGTTGCIAQNVVGFRSKEISPFYLYQYLQYIKNDLVSYNIGSVQPSIKVTHIMKHKILLPTNECLQSFDTLAKSFSEEIYKNCIEIDRLSQLRDTLLPYLMSGEIDVSQVEI